MEDSKAVTVTTTKRGRDEFDSFESDSPEVKRLREDLLDGFEDDEAELCMAGQDLDSFMKSFEEEITASPSAAVGGGEAAAEVVDLTSENGESRPDLGYLLEASDDELGLPPPAASSPAGLGSELRDEFERVESGLGGEFWEMPNYDSFGFGFGESETNYSGEYVALDGLFDYSDLGFRSGEMAHRPETLPAQ